MQYKVAMGWNTDWSWFKRGYFWFHTFLAWAVALGWVYMILAPAIGEGIDHFFQGIYAAVFFKKDHFAYTNGAVFVVAIFFLIYYVMSLFPIEKRWKHYRVLSDIGMLLGFVYLAHNVYQLRWIMMPVTLWWILHRWGGRFILKIK